MTGMRCWTVSVLLFVTMLLFSEAYQMPSLDQRFVSSLQAWSMPAPPSSFGSFKSTWYNEVDNPTARTTVYEDSPPNEFRFVTTGSDWPSVSEWSEIDEEDLPSKPRIVLNPIRRARNWVARRRA